MTSQCSTKMPFSTRSMSAAIQFTGRPMPLKRPCTNTVLVGNDQPGFVLQGGRNALYKVEQSFSPRLDVCAVLDVLRRPERFSRRIVALIEQRLKRLEYKIFVFLLDRFLHLILRLQRFEVRFLRRPECSFNPLLRVPNSIALRNSLDRDRSRASGRTIPWRFSSLQQSCRSPECIVWFPQQCSEHPGGPASCAPR